MASKATEAAGSESTTITDHAHVSVEPEPAGIASLPPELLAVIFEMALSKRRVQYKLPSEVILSHVSSLWRAIAVTTPALWTRINIYSILSDCAAKYLQRSGSQMLLDIRVDIYNADKRIRIRSGSKRNALIQSIVKTIFPHIHRARSLFILSCFELTALTLLSHLSNSVAPHLQRLRMNIGHPATIGPRTAGFKAFSAGLPQLTFLETDLPDCIPLSLQNLTTLHLHTLTDTMNLSYQTFVAIITAPPSLHDLSIRGSLDVSHWPLHVNGPGFSMNNLKALRLPDASLFCVNILLAVSAPNLESLWLGSSFDNYGHLFNAPQMSGHVKFPALKYLTIPSYDFSYNTQFPTAFPTITHLYLPYANFYHDNRFKITFTSHWKHLDTLVTGLIRQAQMVKFHGALCKFLPLRRNAGYPIRMLLIDEDLCSMLKKESPNVSRYVKIDVLSLETYQEPWWIMSHERPMDHPSN
ncbi:hypothetical protein BYT27DRAFT_7198423 [Phlegmacium glaucopus]|nr:hypothetical protein BYT27DRAFT_7198423 [Phlegmacium glaucopus]